MIIRNVPARAALLMWLSLHSLACAPTFADSPWTSNTRRLTAGEPGAPAKIADLAWLAGSWRGEGLGGMNEEHWSAPAGGTMMGMYRLLKGERVAFYELLTLSESEGSLLLTLRHFHPDLRGWEERDDTVKMPFIKAEAGRYYFEGLTMEPLSNGTLTIYLAIEDQGPRGAPVSEVTFNYRRH